LLIGAGVAALVAAVVGFPLMRLSGAGAVIATFALLVIIHVIFINWDQVTNGPRTIFGITRYTNLWVSAGWGLFFILLAYWFKETALGLKLRASREDERAAASIGIDVVRTRWVAFTLSAFVVGVGGVLYAHFITSFSPLAFYLTQTFLIIAMLIIGGTGSVGGAVVGTVVVTTIFEGLRSVETAVNLAQILPEALAGLTEVCLSIAMILILIYRPAGITGGQEFRWPKK
jgi:branched-chain amino acid transport system permease protein